VKLTTRFAVAVAVLVPVLVLLSGLLVLRLASADLRSERDHRLVSRLTALEPLAQTYAQQSRRGGLTQSAAERLGTGASAGTGGLYERVTGGEPLVYGVVPAAADLPAGADGPATFVSGGHRWRYVAADLGRRGTIGRLWVLEPESRLAAQLALLRQRLLVATLVAVGLGAAAGFGLGRIAGRPLRTLRRQAQLIDTPPYAGNRLATASGVVEVDELATLVNRLLDRRDTAVAETGAALETARAFAATAAHELRTPLTSLGANLSLLDHPGLTAEQRAELLTDLTAEHARMQSLITILRQLAHGELIDRSRFSEADLADLVDAAIEDARRRHPRATIEARTTEATVHGWAEGLRLIVDNLLDNAAVHGIGPDGKAAIRVALERDGTWAVLTVDDSGPGIPPDRRAAVFARFHRRRDSPGSGLGLALVAQQAALHGGHITITDPPDGQGTRMTLSLPLPTAASPTLVLEVDR
jgi:two-component system sensor histidine kinase PrrB